MVNLALRCAFVGLKKHVSIQSVALRTSQSSGQGKGVMRIHFYFIFYFYLFIYFLFFSFIFISWRLITLQYCSGFCHTKIHF